MADNSVSNNTSPLTLPEFPSLPFLTRDMLRWGREATFSLRLRAKTVLAGTMQLSGITREGPFTFDIVLIADENFQTFTLRVADVPILVTMSTDDSTYGQGGIFASLELLINSDISFPLATGLVYLQKSVSYPPTDQRDMMPTFAEPVGSTIATPAAGANFTQSVNSGAIKRMRALEFLFVTDANVATRVVQLLITTSAGPFFRFISPTGQAASLTRQYTCCPQTTGAAMSDDNDIIIPIAEEIYVRNGGTITSEVTNLQVTDALSSIRVYWEDLWITG